MIRKIYDINDIRYDTGGDSCDRPSQSAESLRTNLALRVS